MGRGWSEMAEEVTLWKPKDWPKWAEHALQGVSFWIGHRRTMFPGYPLSEGALVAELCNLIHAHLPDNQTLRCEVMYSKLLERRETDSKSVLTERARADLVVVEKRAKSEEAKYVMEVKRLKAGNAQIDADLRRLAEVRSHLPDAHAYLFLIAEAERPSRFVNSNGASIRGKQSIPDCRGHFRVRRTLKAAHAYSNRERAQYACLIEVFPAAVDEARRRALPSVS
jgi:hypothetical protein